MGPLPGPLRLRLNRSFEVAVDRVQRHESCGDLFRALGREGMTMLRATRYSQAEPLARRAVCRGTVTAFSVLGRPRTSLCPSFARLPSQRAALVLVHEALHTAGLSERPVDPEAHSPREIDRLVRERCGF